MHPQYFIQVIVAYALARVRRGNGPTAEGFDERFRVFGAHERFADQEAVRSRSSQAHDIGGFTHAALADREDARRDLW
jgi:hypothetical protein